ncbi:MAG: Eco57I restriction-modification methylase domain-containing protein, partial [Chloroflexi bacterium]|nr:Eco57I restriction-modification methylase domain-containing protein [Chloroflexota bacterium]
MNLDAVRVRRFLRDFAFEDLFIDELGWDVYNETLTMSVDEREYTLAAVAEKRNVVAFLCEVTGDIPLSDVRRKIERKVAEKYREHFIIFVDGDRSRQVWQWARREPGRPLATRAHEYSPTQPGDSLIQKLENIAFSLDEEDNLNVVEVSGRLRAAFNVEHATRRFYDRFKKERTAYEEFITGIAHLETKREYVSVMLNRLMFVYFMQKKGFLDGDPHYLRNRIQMMQAQYGDDQFYSFYRYFLLRLFHEGLGGLARNPELDALLGDVPYLNGGIFELHQIERDNPDIQIPDAAFERILDFFDQYQWHLDDRPLKRDNEINPDVLGYIFEKYINQKQMGAYYTKEDITGYISRNTIIPYLFDTARKTRPAAFAGEGSSWTLLENDPRRYIYPAVQKGVDLPLPDEIAAGIEDVAQRGSWNTRTPDEYALPTEIWRETVARRQRYEDVWLKLACGEVQEINDLITLNLDIQQFAQDAIENCEQPETLRAFWKAIRGVTVLDPTCGSGAFLFAALNILQPLYDACLRRMETFVAELPPEAPVHKLKDFKETLENVTRHPNTDYFILKSIIVDNLYGVDLMAEAVEIAKLRLFLKLAAQVQPDRTAENWGIEPLPDIDFNIRPGNTLVGFATRDDVQRAFRGTGKSSSLLGPDQSLMDFAQKGTQMKILFPDDAAVLQRIEEKAEDIDRLFTRFREMQTAHDMSAYAQDFVETKSELRHRLNDLGEELNQALARQYNVKVEDKEAYAQWLESHNPFHWFIEFYGIMNDGGFDVVIGNPPYLVLRALKEYTVQGFQTLDTKNLYPLILEKCQVLVSPRGREGYIIPVSSIATQGYSSLQNVLKENELFISSYDDRPSHLFTGLDKNTLSIILVAKTTPISKTISTRLFRWNSEEREALFELLQYGETPKNKIKGCIPKIGSRIEASIWEKIFKEPNIIGAFQSRTYQHKTYYSRKVNAFLQILD